VLGVIGAVAKSNKSNTSGGGSKATAVPVSLPSTPAGFTSFRSAADHFSIAVPAGWRSVDPSSPGAQAALNDIEQANPALKSTLGPTAAHLVEQGIAFWGFSPGAGQFSANVSVLAKAAPGYSSSDLSDLAKAAEKEYTGLGATLMNSTTTTVGGQAADRLDITLPINTPSGDRITVHETQYITGANGFVYIITESGDSPSFADITSSFSTK
jgi:hypothetical protein